MIIQVFGYTFLAWTIVTPVFLLFRFFSLCFSYFLCYSLPPFFFFCLTSYKQVTWALHHDNLFLLFPYLSISQILPHLLTRGYNTASTRYPLIALIARAVDQILKPIEGSQRRSYELILWRWSLNSPGSTSARVFHSLPGRFWKRINSNLSSLRGGGVLSEL